MKYLFLSAALFASLMSVKVYGQDNYYYYEGKKIYLEAAPNKVAALVQAGVEVEERYPQSTEVYSSLESAVGPRFETLLISKPSINKSRAMVAINLATIRKEVVPVPVYRLGSLLLIPKSEVIVQFQPSVEKAAREDLLLKFSKNFRELDPPGRYLISLGNPHATLPVSNLLSENNDVASAEPNFIIISPRRREDTQVGRDEGTWEPPDVPIMAGGPLAPPFPSDPRFTRQWYLENRIQDTTKGKFKADIRIRGAWRVTQGSDRIKVAVLDETVDTAHPDLADNIARENGVEVQWDAITEKDKPVLVSSEAHGTRVAGIIAAKIDNGAGIAGVAPNVKIIPIRMGSFEGSPTGLWTDPLTVSRAIRKAVALGADVINCSWDVSPSPVVTADIREAATLGRGHKGVVMVFAAGNTAGPLTYPAKLASNTLPIVAVGATNSWDEVKTVQSLDKEAFWESSSGPELTLVAPGVGIATIDLSTSTGGGDQGYFDRFRGTSAAAPIVSGVVALILSVHPEWEAARVRDQLIQTTDKIAGPNRTDRAGWGRVNACRAVGGTNCD